MLTARYVVVAGLAAPLFYGWRRDHRIETKLQRRWPRPGGSMGVVFGNKAQKAASAKSAEWRAARSTARPQRGAGRSPSESAGRSRRKGREKR